MTEQPLWEWYLEESGGRGRVEAFRIGMAQGYRAGQAFFNALSYADQKRLRGTFYDPFYGDNGYADVRLALEYLMQP